MKKYEFGEKKDYKVGDICVVNDLYIYYVVRIAEIIDPEKGVYGYCYKDIWSLYVTEYQRDFAYDFYTALRPANKEEIEYLGDSISASF